MRLAALGLICALAAAPMFAQTSATVAQEFQNPAKTYRPMVRWWWPGNDVTDAELKREVDLLDKANFGGAEIQPFTIGLNQPMSDAARRRVDDYLSPSFFSHVGAALEEARTRGMWIDLTFGSGWPFGGAGVVTPALASTELASAHQTIRGPVHFHQKIAMPLLSRDILDNKNLPSGWLDEFRQREHLVAVVAVRGSSVQFFPNVGDALRVKATGDLDPNTAIVLTSHMQPNGILDWDVPPGTWQVFAFKEMPTGQEVDGGAGTGPQLVLDHMNKHAFDLYADRVGGTARQYVGPYFGHGLRAVFCDSLEVRANLFWNDAFLQEFQKRRGYDLTPYLPILKVPGFEAPYGATAARLPLYDMKGVGDRVRRDYWHTVSDLMMENFYTPFDQWAASNNLLSRVQAHGSPTDILRVYGDSSIPETEDLLDNGRYDFLKMASSAADLFGRHIVSSESFVWQGRAYQTTPEKIKRFADELLTAGINEIVYHGYPYQRMDRPFPGWHPFALDGAFSSDMNQNNPLWPYLPQLNQYITRLQYLSQMGTTVVPVALYRSMLAYDAIEPPPPEPAIDTDLMASGYNFDHIDSYALLHSRVVGRKLISPGGEAYSALVFTHSETISPALASQILAFARQGLPIIFTGAVPRTNSPIVDGHLTTRPGPDILRAILNSGNARLASNPSGVVPLLTPAVAPGLRFHGASLPFIEKRIGAVDIFFLRNPRDTPARIDADFRAAGTPQLWDPWTGAIHPIVDAAHTAGSHLLHLVLDPYGSALIVFGSSAKPTASPIDLASLTQPEQQIPIGAAGWTFHGVGIGPGSHNETIDLKLSSLEDWTMNDRLRHFSGRGQYTTTFNVPASLLASHRRIVLDLGAVGNVAQITLNNRPGPTLLLCPYRTDVTSLIHPGENSLQVTVTNALFNALSANGRSANYYPEQTGFANGLLPSGLVGPVQLETMKPGGYL